MTTPYTNQHQQLVEIPVINSVLNQLPLTSLTNITSTVMTVADGLPDGDFIYLDLANDAMSPELPHDTRVLVQRQGRVANDSLAAVSFGREIKVGRVTELPNGWILSFDNPLYQPAFISPNSSKINFIGRIIRSIRTYS